VRLERISFAFADGKQAKDPCRMFVRIGGKADHQRLVDAIKKLSPETMIQETKDDKVRAHGDDPARRARPRPSRSSAITDLVIAGEGFPGTARQLDAPDRSQRRAQAIAGGPRRQGTQRGSRPAAPLKDGSPRYLPKHAA